VEVIVYEEIRSIFALCDACLGIAVAKDNIALANEFNKALAKLRRSGEYKIIYNSYFGA